MHRSPPPLDDDLIASWLRDSPPQPTGDDSACHICGYVGPLDPGGTCPACLAVIAPPIQPPVIECPDCHRSIALVEADRGRTLLCPGCKRFLGCHLPNRGRRPWWSRRREARP